MRLLFIGALPEPMTGQALAGRVLLEGLPGDIHADVIDLSKRQFRQGFDSFGRSAEVARILWRVWRRRRHADVIYLTVSESIAGNLKDLAIYLLCIRQLRRMAIHLHGGAGMKRLMASAGPLRRLNATFLSRLGGVVILGPSHRAIYRGVVPEARLHVVPNFAEDSLFTTVERIDAKFRNPAPFRVLFLSNLLPGKGHLELLEAFAGLGAALQSQVELHFAGGFESDAQKDAFLSRIAVFRQIRYHGTVSGAAKVELFANAHLFCLPTYYPYEGQPISILEAYASGCAVVTTDHSGIPDVFADGVNGYRVERQSVSTLRAALERALADPEALRRMAVTNFQTAVTTFRADTYRQGVVRVLRSVAESGGQR